MKLLHVVVLGYCLTSKAFGNAIPKIGETPSASEDYDKRQIGSLPLKPVICDDYSVIPSDISKAMTQAINSINNNYPKGGGDYPHEFKNYEGFIFANCPQGSGTLFEYPVMRNAPNPWVPAKNTKLSNTEFDRVIFQNTAGGYCGMATHSGAAKGAFQQCL